MYLSTVDLATSIPSLASSPTIRGEPQRGLVVDISRIRSRTASSSAGRPAGLPGQPSPVLAEPASLPGDDRARLHEHENVPPPSPDSRQPGPKEAVGDVWPDSQVAALIDGQLVS